MKDYYVRTKKSGSTGSSASVKKRMERLTFLEGTNIVNRPTTSNVSNPGSNDDIIDIDFDNIETSTDFGDDDVLSTFSGRTIKKSKKSGNSSSTMMVESLNKDRELRHKDKMNALHSIITATKEKTPPKLDAVDHFLQSIGETIKNFPPRKLCEVKLKIMNVVSEMEMQIHEETEKMTFTIVDPNATILQYISQDANQQQHSEPHEPQSSNNVETQHERDLFDDFNI